MRQSGNLFQKNKLMNEKSFMIGDQWRDIQSGEKAGCKTIFLDYKYKDKKPKNPDFVTDTLLNAVFFIEKLLNKNSL